MRLDALEKEKLYKIISASISNDKHCLYKSLREMICDIITKNFIPQDLLEIIEFCGKSCIKSYRHLEIDTNDSTLISFNGKSISDIYVDRNKKPILYNTLLIIHFDSICIPMYLNISTSSGSSNVGLYGITDKIFTTITEIQREELLDLMIQYIDVLNLEFEVNNILSNNGTSFLSEVKTLEDLKEQYPSFYNELSLKNSDIIVNSELLKSKGIDKKQNNINILNDFLIDFGINNSEESE